MKKSILFFLIFLFSFSFGQDLESNKDAYYIFYPELNDSRIYLSASRPNESRNFDYTISFTLSNNLSASMSFDYFSEKQIKETLTHIKNKFIEWKNVAENNNIDEYTKEIDKYWFGDFTFSVEINGKYYFSFYSLPTAYFIYKENSTGIYITANNLDFKNKTANDLSVGFVLVNESDFDKLINAIDSERVFEYYKKHPIKDELFK